MTPGESVFRSLLDKSLGQLTEDDISQLTREDCRRYLKQKGMRRPSWNKSQAIEQVISLKALLETTTDSDISAGFRPDILVSFPENSSHVPLNSEKVTTSADFQVSYRPNDILKPLFFGDVPCHLPISDDDKTSPRNMGAINGSVDQMTIFYGGKVNVYDGMPAEKAQMILKLAADPMYLPQDTPAGNAADQSVQCQLQAASIEPGLTSVAVSPTMQNVIAESSRQCKDEGALSREVKPEGTASRKVSLQRYLEKRRDRGKFRSKRKIGVSSSSGLEIYLNQQVRGLNPNEQSSRRGTWSLPQLRLPHTPSHCNSVENQDKNIC